MGTDIHIHLERRSRNTLRYKYISEIKCQRNYHMFEVMFGDEELGKKEYLFRTRGLPGDVTQATLKEYRNWRGDAHHASWLTTIEFSACIVETYIRMNSIEQLQLNMQYEDLYTLIDTVFCSNKRQDEDNLFSYIELLKLMISYEVDKEECRIVFWFDN